MKIDAEMRARILFRQALSMAMTNGLVLVYFWWKRKNAIPTPKTRTEVGIAAIRRMRRPA